MKKKYQSLLKKHRLSQVLIDDGVSSSYGSYARLAELWSVTPLVAEDIIECAPTRVIKLWERAQAMRDDLVMAELLKMIKEGNDKALKLYLDFYAMIKGGEGSDPDENDVIRLVEIVKGNE